MAHTAFSSNPTPKGGALDGRLFDPREQKWPPRKSILLVIGVSALIWGAIIAAGWYLI